MAKDETPDPTVQFQEWVTQWERSVDEFSNRMMGTDEFSRSMNQMQGLQFEMQKRFSEYMSTQLANMNMPSRDDILQLGEDVRELDRRLAHIETAINKLVPAPAGEGTPQRRKGPARTRKPPSATETTAAPKAKKKSPSKKKKA